MPLYWMMDAERRVVEEWTPALAFPRVEQERVIWQPGTRRTEERSSMRDTSSAAAAAQTQAQRELGGPGRLRLAFEMSVLARELSLVRLRQAHPDWSRSQLSRELLRLSFLPDDLPLPLR